MATRGRETEKSIKQSSASDQITPASENSISVQTDPEENRLNYDSNESSVQSVKKNSGPRYVFSTDIPDSYEENYVCAIPKNPEWMFVYWELSSTSQNRLKTSLNGEIGQTVLKLTEWNKTSTPSQPETTIRPAQIHAPATQHSPLHTHTAHNNPTAESHFDEQHEEAFHIGVKSTPGESYIRIPVPGKEYRVEFGQVVPPGIYMPLSDSGHKSVPDSVIEKAIDEYTIKKQNEENPTFEGTNGKLHIENTLEFNTMHSPASIYRNDGSFKNLEASLDKQCRPDISSESSRYLGSAAKK